MDEPKPRRVHRRGWAAAQLHADLERRLAQARCIEGRAWANFFHNLDIDDLIIVRGLMNTYLRAADYRIGIERKIGVLDEDMQARERLHVELHRHYKTPQGNTWVLPAEEHTANVIKTKGGR